MLQRNNNGKMAVAGPTAHHDIMWPYFISSRRWRYASISANTRTGRVIFMHDEDKGKNHLVPPSPSLLHYAIYSSNVCPGRHGDVKQGMWRGDWNIRRFEKWHRRTWKLIRAILQGLGIESRRVERGVSYIVSFVACTGSGFCDVPINQMSIHLSSDIII